MRTEEWAAYCSIYTHGAVRSFEEYFAPQFILFGVAKPDEACVFPGVARPAPSA